MRYIARQILPANTQASQSPPCPDPRPRPRIVAFSRRFSPPRMHPSHARSLGHIHELLTMIFSYLDDRDLAGAACVCKHWAEIALDTLWFEVHDLRRVLTVLAPLTLKPERVSVAMGRLPGAYVGRTFKSLPHFVLTAADAPSLGVQTTPSPSRLAAIPTLFGQGAPLVPRPTPCA